MGILRRRKEGDADPKRRRKLALTFSIFAVSVGVTFTWFAKDKETGERPRHGSDNACKLRMHNAE
jgi:hypothetical protein